MELSSTDRDAAIAMLQTRLSYRDLRAVIQEEQRGGRRRKGVEWIFAEMLKGTGDRRLQSKVPDGELAEFLVDLKGSDLLSSRELRKRLALATDRARCDHRRSPG